MSFLDRFQSKIATVTAQGHLRKADGSEEVRVGPPKRRTQPQQTQPQRDKPNNANNQAPHRGGDSARRRQEAPPNQQSLNSGRQPQGRGDGRQPASNSPSMSPRNRPSAYDSSPRGGIDNNNVNNGGRSNRSDYYDQTSIPGRMRDEYDDASYQQQPGSRSPRRGNGGDSPRSVVNDRTKDERTPKDVNEARVQTDEDQLAFSRKARPVQYEPCKLAQYKKEKPAGYYELGKLQPDLNSDELVQKRANAERIKAFSKGLRDINKASSGTKKPVENNEQSPKKPKSTRDKALEFAKRVPKPKAQRGSPEDDGGAPPAAKQSVSSKPLPHVAAPSRPINSVIDDDSEDDELSSELQQLQQRHQQSRAQVDAIIGSG